MTSTRNVSFKEKIASDIASRDRSTLDTIAAVVKPGLAVIGTAALGILGFWLTPLKQIVMHRLYDEKATIILTADSTRVHAGETINVKAIVSPMSSVPLTDGHFSLEYDPTFLRVTKGTVVVPTTGLSESRVLPDESGVTFEALAPGVTEVRASLTTRYRRYPPPISSSERNSHPDPTLNATKIEILSNETSQQVTRENFTGTWQIWIGKSQGKMVLKQVTNSSWTNIPGNYYLDDGNIGSVVGAYHDGENFGGYLMRGASVTRWAIDRIPFVVTKDRFIVISGVVQLEQADSKSWKAVGAPDHFEARIALR